MVKGVVYVGLAAVAATAMTLLPIVVQAVEATPAEDAAVSVHVKTMPDCGDQAWPYYTRACLRDGAGAPLRPRAVRVLPLDRIAAADRDP